jgi:uncharacterized protein YyaL (SSP411 family)
MWRTIFLTLLLIALPLSAAAPPQPKPKKPNRLARESSPYLLQHAHNPVNWYPWGEEAFAKAKKEGKLVFLSIGYSSCHWCHVMEKESFSSDDVAKILNDHFVCIKVDREERPDIDHIYMTALNVMGSNGGWPLSMFMDHQGRPIVGGTYWPKDDVDEDGKTIRGFKSILLAMHNANKNNNKDVMERAESMASRTRATLAGLARGLSLVELDRKLVDAVSEELVEQFDKPNGGFGRASRQSRPKFPLPTRILFAQAEAKRSKSKDLTIVAETTLDKMARGGIYDHLGGGFHRYSVDRTWTVPHFEKMLYDNAQLLEAYAAAYRETKKPLHARVLRQTIDWVAREMTSPEGAFYSALDADSEGEEGRFYVWTAKELAAALDKDDLQFFRRVYGAKDGYNFEGKYHVLRLPTPLAELAEEQKTTEAKLEARLAPLRKKLFDVRARRERPFLDKKVLTGWNGQMIAGLARAGDALGDKDAVASARKAADFLLKTMKTKEGRLLRSYAAAPNEKAKARHTAFLDDYAYLVHGLLTLHEVTKEKRWLDESKALTQVMSKFFAAERGAFYFTPSDGEKLFARAIDQYDAVQPSGNSQAAANLIRLWIVTGDKKYADQAEKTFKVLSATLKNEPATLTTLADALAVWLAKKGKKE